MNTGVRETLWFQGQFSASPYLFQWIRVTESQSQEMQMTLQILVTNVYLVTFCDVFCFTNCIAATPTLPMCQEH